jgi:hypothetical protein
MVSPVGSDPRLLSYQVTGDCCIRLRSRFWAKFWAKFGPSFALMGPLKTLTTQATLLKCEKVYKLRHNWQVPWS